jgi:hypothetical protein
LPASLVDIDVVPRNPLPSNPKKWSEIMLRVIVTVVGLMSVCGSTVGQDKPKADPEGTPLTLTITGKQTKYVLDTGRLTPAEFKQQIERAIADGGQLPAPPAIDLSITITNTSDKPIQVWVKGDPVILDVELKGKGAINAAPLLAFTQEFRSPEAVEIPAGKTHTIPLKSLTSGFRGAAKFAYWTQPGEYELVATLKTGVAPAPKGAAEGMDGFGIVRLTSPAFKVTVEAKK